MRFGAWLLAARTARGPDFSQKHLATLAAELDSEAPESERARFFQPWISQWERGVSRPSFRQFEVLLIALDCSEQEARAGRTAWKAEELRGLPVARRARRRRAVRAA